MNFNIAVIPGDGIGPEVIDESIKVLNKIGEKYPDVYSILFLPSPSNMLRWDSASSEKKMQERNSQQKHTHVPFPLQHTKHHARSYSYCSLLILCAIRSQAQAPATSSSESLCPSLRASAR